MEAAVGGGVAGGAHQATVTTVDQTQIITLQVRAVPGLMSGGLMKGCRVFLTRDGLVLGGEHGGASGPGPG